jgi:diguanylate cyclase (GGDEF)-like protein
LKDHEPDNPLQTAERDVFALGIAVAAMLLLVATGRAVLPSAVRSLLGDSTAPDRVLVSALLLNIALIIFGWRRYRELTREIAERRRAEDQARLLAATDPLTQCLNRRSMIEATEALRTAAAERGEAVAYCMIDLDNFKQINDMYGHTYGDAVLVKLCERLRALLPREARLARLGGDEFAFVMAYPVGHTDRIDDLVIRLFANLAEPLEVLDITLELTISIGLATDHDDWVRRSAFEHLLGRAPHVMLETCRRMCSELVRFSSEAWYDGRVRSDPGVAGRRLRLRPPERRWPRARSPLRRAGTGSARPQRWDGELGERGACRPNLVRQLHEPSPWPGPPLGRPSPRDA